MDKKIGEKIISFISKEPRSIHEVSKAIGKCWKTTDKYLNELASSNPSIAIKVFRKGSHGALKIAFLKNIAQTNSDIIQEKFFKKFINGHTKDDFDVLDLFMQVSEGQKKAIIEQYKNPNISTKQSLIERLDECQHTLYVFSGNLSWINMKENKKPILFALSNLLKRQVKIKILCRIDPSSIKLIDKLKSLDKKNATNLIQIRHVRQPLRGFIFDDKVVRLKEETKIWRFIEGEVKHDLRTIYDIFDQKWVDWFKNIFYYSFNSSMTLEKYQDYIENLVNYL